MLATLVKFSRFTTGKEPDKWYVQNLLHVLGPKIFKDELQFRDSKRIHSYLEVSSQ